MELDVTRLRAIFDEVIQLPPVERAARLEARCEGRSDLRRRLEALIATAEDGDCFLRDPTAAGPPDGRVADTTRLAAPLSERPGTRIGPYKLLEQIGEGGFGVVFMAEQEEPVVRRVALKVIKLGMDTRAVVARFEAERQALAMMEHPGIARVLDAGATETGRPYFVMELVRGIPITDYCSQNDLSPRKRCELFAAVCHAVQHAHTKGIIHRDLKPSNVLVTLHDGEPVPKVIDFGIAKATGGKLTEKTLFTAHRAMIGTPAYMSPEQAEMSGLDVDTRSDVYSLGVLLYELLTGTTPFDATELVRSGLAGMQRMIRELEPERPSTRVSKLGTWGSQARRHGPGALDGSGELTLAGGLVAPAAEQESGIVGARARASSSVLAIARQRRPDPQLARTIRGDLDWIVMKCLEKDRRRRYETASGLAHDIQRYLKHEPVAAGPPSQSYRLRKFVQRNRVMVMASAIVSLAMLLGGIGTTVGMIRALRSDAEARRQARIAGQNEQTARGETARAEREAEAARQERDKAERIARFMAGMLEGVKPSVALGRDTTLLREMLDTAARRIEQGDMQDSPEAELRLRWTIGSAYQDIAADGALQRAETILLPTLTLAEQAFGPESEEMAASLSRVADCLESLGRAAEALAQCEAALEIRRKLYPGDHPNVAQSLTDVAFCLNSLHRHAAALSVSKAALEMRRRLLSGDHPELAESLDLVARCQSATSQNAEAFVNYRMALEMRRRLSPGDNPDLAGSLHNLATCLQVLGRSAEALPRFEAALEMNQRIFHGDHPEVATSLATVAGCLQSLDRPAEALPKFEAALEMRRRLYRGDHPVVALSLGETANCLNSVGRCTEALPMFEAALEMSRRLFDGDRAEVAGSLNNLALCIRALGRPQEALPRFEAAHAMNERLYSGDHPDLAATLGNVALGLQDLGRSEEALPKFDASLEMTRRLYPGDHSNIAISLDNLANCQMSLGLAVQALPNYQAALQMVQRLFPGDHARVASALNSVANCLWSLGRSAEALPKYAAALKMRQALFTEDHPDVAVSLHNLADCLHAQGRSAEALPRYNEALAMSRRLYGQSHPLSAFILHHVADCLHQQGDSSQAEQVAREAVQVYRAHPDWSPDEHRHAEQVLADILVAKGNTVEAAEGLRTLVALHRARLPEMDARRASGLAALASLLLKDAAPASALEAEALLAECLAIRENALGSDHVAGWLKHETMSKLGAALAAQGKFAQAEPLLLNGYNGLKDNPRVPPPSPKQDRRRDALERIVELYEAWDAAEPGREHAEKAAAWRSRLMTQTSASRESPTR